MEKISFGDKLKFLRIKSGLTQSQLAEKLNISPSTIGMYEQGRREPDNKTLIKLCNILDTSVDYLLGLKHKNVEIDKIISDFINYIESREDLMFNGHPVSENERKKISKAIKIASDISMSDL